MFGGMTVREGALCHVGIHSHTQTHTHTHTDTHTDTHRHTHTHTHTHTQLAGKPITAGLKFFYMTWCWEGKPLPTEPGLLNEVNH